MDTAIQSEPILEASGINFQNINFRYFQTDKRPVFENFSMQVKKNNITVITGPSGCGKSTLLYLAAGLYPEHSGVLEEGQVLVDGQNIQEMDALARSQSIRLVFQNADLQFCFPTVEKEIVFSMETANVPPEEMPARLEKALEAVNLKGFETRLIHTLSGGEKQRLSLACQLVSQAKWLLLDEIFAQVDESQIKAMVEMLVELKNTYHLSYLIVDHHLENWEGIADEYFLLNQQGKLIAGPEKTRHFTPQDWNEAGVICSENLYPKRANLLSKKDDTKEDGKAFISVRNLSVRYGKKLVLDSLSFDLEKGKIYALMGASGIGKTTLLKALGGFIPSQGDIVRTDIKVDHQTRLQKIRARFKKQTKQPFSMRYVFQNPQDQFLTDRVSDEVLLSLKDLYGGDKERQRNKAIELLKENLLWELRRQAPFQLSEGQQRRLAVITLLSEEAELILCDEPTYAQDYKNTLAIMDLLVDAAHKRESTLVFTTHDRNLANHYADHILIMGGHEDGMFEEDKGLCII